MTKKNIIISGIASQDQIAKWKKEFGSVFEYKTEDNKVGYFRSPNLVILDACKTMTGKSSIKFNTMLTENCWLGGDEAIKKEDQYLLGLFEFLAEIIIVKSGEFKRL